MTRYFTLAEARALLPEAQERIHGVADLMAELQTLVRALRAEHPAAADGGLPEAKSLEARIHEGLEWFEQAGIQVKGVAPALLDFPAQVGGEEVLLCWLEGEADIDHFHPTDSGFLGRAPITELGLDAP